MTEPGPHVPLKAGDHVQTPQGPGRYVGTMDAPDPTFRWARRADPWLIVALDEGGRRFYAANDVRRIEDE